jgi:tetratricopeptide (TPR) repeat protein
MRTASALLLVAVSATTAAAQSAADHVALGDRDYAALRAESALAHYEAAIAADPGNYAALWKASRSAVDMGSYGAGDKRRQTLFEKAEQYARRAVASDPGDAEGFFSLARALGKTALEQSARGRVRYATEIRARALECLKIKPSHAGCLHVMGVWNAEVMRLNSVTRLIAKNVLGGRVFGTASWNEAVRYMEASVESEPERIVHRVDLAEIYRDVGSTARAREAYEAAIRLPVTDVNDVHYKAQARAGLAALR